MMTGCEERVAREGDLEKSQEKSSAQQKSQEKNDGESVSEIEPSSETYDEVRPEDEEGIYSVRSVYEMYFTKDPKTVLEASVKQETAIMLFGGQEDFLDHWEFWVEQRHNPNENDRDGIMKISGKMYEEYEAIIQQILALSREVKDRWKDIHEEVLTTCKNQKQSVKCKR